MKIWVSPGKALRGVVGAGESLDLPGDKSLSHRVALLASMAEGRSQVDNFLVAGVTRVMLEALTKLEVTWRIEGKQLTVEGTGLRRHHIGEEAVRIHCGNSATTLRLLAGAMGAWGRAGRLDGTEGLRRRPMGRIVEPLQTMGVSVQATNGGAPVVFKAGQAGLRAIDWDMGVASAQVKSCILLAALRADGASIVAEPGPSRDHTERMLRSMGVNVTNEKSEAGGGEAVRYITRITPPASGRLEAINFGIPGDFSAAAFLIVAALITPGSDITIRGVGLNPTRSGLVDALRSMGADLEISNLEERQGEPVGDVRARYSELVGTLVEGETVVRMIDEFPAFAAAASFARGTTQVKDAQELRVKESDRISDLCTELCKLGVEVEETQDGFVLEGGKPVRGGKVETHRDHRLAMSLAVMGLAGEGTVEVEGAEMVEESFPHFAETLQTLGAEVACEP
jgi:3-phosphoshikimate 1-carboxyvinyltransferase